MPKCHKCAVAKECGEIGLQIKDDTGTPKKACPLLWSVSVANFVMQELPKLTEELAKLEEELKALKELEKRRQ